jgi:serine/threonine protein kinase
MEYLMGPSLATYLRELHSHNQRLQPAQIARLLITIATALDYAHERGVIHRDIKPGNIILHNKASNISTQEPITERTDPVLTDFGLVRIAQAVTQTASGLVSGTPAYMSPEQAQGLKVDHRTDIYSLGVVLYEMIAGRIPFEGDTSWTVIFKHINEPPPSIAGIQPVVQKVIERALAKKPEDRYQTARALAADYMDAIGMVAEANTLRMSLPASRTPPPATISKNGDQPSAPTWIRIASFSVIGLFIVGLAAFTIPRLMASNQPTQIPNLTGSPTASSNVISPVDLRAPVGLLRFQDGTAPADTVTISTATMPPPPTGSQYEAWLIEDDGEGRISIGIIKFDQNNKGSLTFVDSGGRNLLGTYSALEITIEPNPDPNPNSSNNVAFSVKLPPGGLMHVRHLLYSFSATPKKIGFIRGLDADTNLLTQSATQMLTSFQSGNKTDVLLQAESMLNLIVGSHSEDHKDWNGNGKIDDPGDGYGLLLNGDNLGYIQGTRTHADLAITSPDASQNMLVHGGHVKISADNVSNWTAELRAQLIDILQNPSGEDNEGAIRQAVATANQIRTGVDLNGNETIEPIPGEGGALTAYEHAYYMADMLILPVPKP